MTWGVSSSRLFPWVDNRGMGGGVENFCPFIWIGTQAKQNRGRGPPAALAALMSGLL